MPAEKKVKGLRERFADGDTVLAAEGYLFEMERRGYLQAGAFVPEVVLEHPELVRQLTREFVHAGSEVVLAFTYYGHREKLRLINRENDLEKLNTTALQIAREVADETGTLMAGNICNTTCYAPNDEKALAEVRKIFKEEVEWAVKGGADFLLAETYCDSGEAMLALEAMQKYGNGLPTLIMLTPIASMKTFDGLEYADALLRLEQAGADCVGLNCSFGPQTMVEEMRKIRKVCKGPIACLPAAYRTTPEEPQMQALKWNGKQAFYDDLDAFCCPRSDFADFGAAMRSIGVNYVGVCCGNSSRYFRTLAESMGRRTEASRYSTDMSKHFTFGENESFNKMNTETLNSGTNGIIFWNIMPRCDWLPSRKTFVRELKNISVHVFPEGKVNMERVPMRFKWGIGRLLLDTQRDPVVLPFWIVGSHHVLHPTKKPYIPRVGKKVTIYFPPAPLELSPILPDCRAQYASGAITAAEARKRLTDMLQHQLYALKAPAEAAHFDCFGDVPR